MAQGQQRCGLGGEGPGVFMPVLFLPTILLLTFAPARQQAVTRESRRGSLLPCRPHHPSTPQVMLFPALKAPAVNVMPVGLCCQVKMVRIPPACSAGACMQCVCELFKPT